MAEVEDEALLLLVIDELVCVLLVGALHVDVGVCVVVGACVFVVVGAPLPNTQEP